MNNFLVGCVGKPSAGKSSFLNAATEANAKVGNYPFTTIEPNIGVTYFQTECPCAKFDKTDVCDPRYGKCDKGTRFIPVKMLDVAGLVPGASEGKGLGNKFLDDLRHAHVLLHIIDVSGRTNEKGEETIGYDPIKDADWLQEEIHSWIYNNLDGKWDNIKRKHVATKSTAVHTLQLQLSGYGANQALIAKCVEKLGIKEPSGLENWEKDFVKKVVWVFMEERFPTILVLNKIDRAESDANIAKLCQKYDPDKIVLSSALAETFLRKMMKEGFIHYKEGADSFTTFEEEKSEKGSSNLKPLDDKTRKQLEKIRDLILFRYGSTGIQDSIKKAVELRQLVPVYPVKSLSAFTCDQSKGAFRDCNLVEPGTTVREYCRMLSSEMEKNFLYAEGVDGRRIADDEVLTKSNNIVKFTCAVSDTSMTTHKETKSADKDKPTSSGKKPGKEEQKD